MAVIYNCDWCSCVKSNLEMVPIFTLPLSGVGTANEKGKYALET